MAQKKTRESSARLWNERKQITTFRKQDNTFFLLDSFRWPSLPQPGLIRLFNEPNFIISLAAGGGDKRKWGYEKKFILVGTQGEQGLVRTILKITFCIATDFQMPYPASLYLWVHSFHLYGFNEMQTLKWDTSGSRAGERHVDSSVLRLLCAKREREREKGRSSWDGSDKVCCCCRSGGCNWLLCPHVGSGGVHPGGNSWLYAPHWIDSLFDPICFFFVILVMSAT